MSLHLEISDYIIDGFINGNQKQLLVECLKKIGFKEYIGYKKENDLKDKDAIEKSYFRWFHKIGFVKNEKKIFAEVMVEKNSKMIIDKQISSFWIYNVTKKEADDVLEALKSIQQNIGELKIMSHGGFLDKNCMF